MWDVIYDEQGLSKDPKTNKKYDTRAFKTALQKQHQPTSKVELLSSTFQPVEGETIFSADRTNELTNFITDGSIDVDTTRAIRRTAEVTLMNPSAEFTPATGDFKAEGPWTGKIYLNRFLRLWKGLYIDNQIFYVPVGTFMVDIADVMVEQNMSLVNLTLSDLFKTCMKSFVGAVKKGGPNQTSWERNTPYNTIIKDMLDDCGIQTTGPKRRAILDGLEERDVEDRKTNKRIKLDVGDSRGERLKEMCDSWGIDIYVDPLGIFRTEDMRSDDDREEVWHYESREQDDQGRSGMVISMRRSFNDDNLYNHVIIIGTGGSDDKNPHTPKSVRSSRIDTSTRSKTSVDKIGDRVYLRESDKISTQAEADRARNRAWKLRFQLSEEMEVQAICNPLLEGNDMVRITETRFIKIDDTYRIKRFNVPFVTSLQTLQAANIIRASDL